MSHKIEFLTVEDVQLIHSRLIEQYGGESSIRSQKLLEAAIATPQATFDGDFLHTDLFEMAASYAYHISQNQPFMDGNKRTGLLAALIFLDLNQITLNRPSANLYNIMIEIADGKSNKSDLATLFRELVEH